VKLGESSSSKAPHDLSYYARLATVTRLTRKAVSKPNTSNTNPKVRHRLRIANIE
jgi:hypothetical protein